MDRQRNIEERPRMRDRERGRGINRKQRDTNRDKVIRATSRQRHWIWICY